MSEKPTKPDADQPNTPDEAVANVNAVTIAPVHNPRFKYTLVYPNGQKQTKGSSITGWLSAREVEEFLIPTLLHGKPLLSRVEDLRAVNRLGEDLKEQPAVFAYHQRKAAARAQRRGGSAKMTVADLPEHLQQLHAEEGDRAIHPGVKSWTPPPPGEEVYDDPDAPKPRMAPLDHREAGDESRTFQPLGEQDAGLPAARPRQGRR